MFTHSLFAVCHVITYPRIKILTDWQMVKTSSIFEKVPFKKMFRNSKIEKEKLIDLKNHRDERFEVDWENLCCLKNFCLGSVAYEEYVLYPWLKKVQILEFLTPKNVIQLFFSQVFHRIAQWFLIKLLKLLYFRFNDEAMENEWTKLTI